MSININRFYKDYDFEITGASYIGKPKSNTVMYITKKVESLINNLIEVKDCLVFAETGINVPTTINKKNVIIITDNPSNDYVSIINIFYEEKLEKEKNAKYIRQNDSLIESNAIIGKNCIIEPGCIIGCNVVIRDNVLIKSGAILRDCEIGNNSIINEHAIIGAFSFTMTDDLNGNKIRIPSLGRIVIGHDAEIGTFDNISVSSAEETIIGDYTKLDTHVHVSHDVKIGKNVEIAAGTMIGGFATIGDKTFIGLNSTIRNRITIGDNCFISMGSIVEKDVNPNSIVMASASKHFERRS